MPRQHIKVYLNDDWIKAIHKDVGDDTVSSYVRDCIQRRLKKSANQSVRTMAKGLPEIRAGRQTGE